MDVAELLVAGQLTFGLNGVGLWDIDQQGPYMTPLRLLLDHEAANAGSFRMLCQAWPGVVHVKSTRESRETILMHLMKINDSNTGIRRDLLKIILDAAKKTPEGYGAWFRQFELSQNGHLPIVTLTLEGKLLFI